MIAIRDILVATDFSDCSQTALEYAKALARQSGARLHVIHMIGTLAGADVGIDGLAMAAPEWQAQVEDDAREALNALLTAEDLQVLQARASVLHADSAAEGIVRYARNERIDLVVIGTHGRRGLTRLILGSVAEQVVRTAPCPVLTVRYPEREFVHPDALVKTTQV